MAGTKIRQRSGVADGATAIGHELDTQTSLVTSGAKLLSIKNAGVEKFSVDKDGNVSTGKIRVVQLSEGAAGISAALGAMHLAGGGTVQLLAGTYTVSGNGILANYATNNVTLQGVGDDTIISVQSGGGFPSGNAALNFGYGTVPYGLGQTPANDVTKGDTSVYVKTPNEWAAANAQAGDRVWVLGTLAGKPVENRYIYAELHTASGPGNGTTGEIPLTSPIIRSMATYMYVFVARDGANNAIKNLRIQYNSGTQLSNCIYMDYGYNNLIENVTFENFTGMSYMNAAIQAAYNFNLTVRNCRFSNLQYAAVAANGEYHLYEKNTFEKLFVVGGSQTAAIMHQGMFESIFRDNTFRNILAAGISGNYGSGTYGTGHLFERNTFYNLKYNPIAANATSGCRILNNIIDTVTDANGIELNYSHNQIVEGNIIRNVTQGVRCQQATDTGLVISNNLFENVTPYDAISIQDGVSISVTGNILRNCQIGIDMYADKSVVAGNTIDTVVGNGIAVAGDATVIADNTLRSCGTGIVLYGGSTNNVVMGNNCLGQGITNSGTGNDLIGNKS